MDFSQFMQSLRARRKAFVLVFAAVVLAAIAVAMVVPKRYVASATIIVDARDEQTMSPTRMSVRERGGYINTQTDLLQSGRVATQVVRDLKLVHQPGVREAWESDTGGVGSIEHWVAEGLLEKLKVATSASNVVTVTYSATDPRTAAAVANGFVKAYLATSLALRTEPSREAAEWFQDQLKGLRARANQAQGKLVAFQKQKSILATSERADVEAARLGELSTQLLAARNAVYEAESRHQEALQALSRGTPEAIPAALTDAYLNAVRTDLVRAEARLEESSAVLGPNHPVYQRTVAEAQGLREKLVAETKKLVAGLGSTLQQSKRRVQDLEAAMKAQEAHILRLRDHQAELAVLNRDVESAQRAYDAVLTRYQSNAIDSRAKQTNVAMLTPAIEPALHAHPRVGLISILAVLVGAMLAAGVVFLLESLDRRVRSRFDLESRLAVPSLGILSRWQPSGGRLLPAPLRAARALPQPW